MIRGLDTDEQDEIRSRLFGIEDDTEEQSSFDDISDFVEDTDFSEVRGDFKKSFRQVKKKLAKRKKRKPLSKKIGVNNFAKIRGKRRAIAKIIVPNDRKTIVQGVSKFIVSQSSTVDAIKNLGYYKGEKLKELNFTFNNGASALDFNFELFNPSEPLDYLQSTGLNLNDKIEVGGGITITYSDVLFNILANPVMVVNCKIIVSAPTQQILVSQINQSFSIRNKSITGERVINPLNLAQQIDSFQYQSNIVVFDMPSQLGRPFIADGMDIISYNVLAGATVTFAFFYKQHQLKRLLFDEIKNRKDIL